MKRYECLQAIAPAFTDEIVVGSVGGVRPVWHSLWGHGTNFYMVNMGMASSIALGLALQSVQPEAHRHPEVAGVPRRSHCPCRPGAQWTQGHRQQVP